jgi:hypothetical protein
MENGVSVSTLNRERFFNALTGRLSSTSHSEPKGTSLRQGHLVDSIKDMNQAM